MWNLKTKNPKNRLTDIANKLMVTKGERQGGIKKHFFSLTNFFKLKKKKTLAYSH